jgi:transcriptional regulator with XRE-family HTH domain
MPKQPTQHLGHKLKYAIEKKGVSQAEVARVFGVKAPTVSSDWIKFGRIGKKHYPMLVEYFERPYEWWFGQSNKLVFYSAHGPAPTMDELSSGEAKLLAVWRRLTDRQQADYFEKIEATAASNIEIAKHLGKDGAGIKRIVPDNEVEERFLRNTKPGDKKPRK